MPSFSIEELQKSVYGNALNASELTSKKVEEVVKVVGRRGKRSMEQSEALIKEFILQSEEPVTMLQICDHIGRAPAPHFRKIVDNLVKSGVIAKGQDLSIGGNLPRFWFWRP